ncbi:DUF3426 domain-containing protein [Pseudomaricurvus alkylphenolicus]|uniref:DUF3426 domain-containing protein n=1 Tax=Pseudomaricurvus alkylphenolicus TaxID=1306991 RepID=UPI00141F4120|nr:DUF3426 domain-containing protein [Pseudomaricurvus alkylphenolicus]NIB39133.1 DUF3426 domain-containing protein [Pseudomaricurvus alkylphenolicus]
MADRVTCCPHCSTSFRITDAQLQTAKGAVRCGSCLQIFRALDHLVEEPSSHLTEHSPANAADQQDDDDDLMISDDMDQIEDTQGFRGLGDLSDEFLQEGTSLGEQRGSLFDRELKLREPEEPDDADESWAMDLLDEAEQDTTQPVLKSLEEEIRELERDVFSDDDNNLDDFSNEEELEAADDLRIRQALEAEDKVKSEGRVESKDSAESGETFEPKDLFEAEITEDSDVPEDLEESEKPFTLDDLEVLEEDEPPQEEEYEFNRATTGTFSTLSDTDIVESLDAEPFERQEPTFRLEDLDELDNPPDQPAQSPETSDHPQEIGPLEDLDNLEDFEDLDALDSNDFDEELDTHPEDLAEEIPETETTEPSAKELLNSIEAAPVEMEWHQQPNPWPARALWGGLSLVAGLLLVAQLAWLKFDDLSRQQPYRDWYAAACSLLDCKLPSVARPDLVKAYNLVIRSHPEVQNALVIDCILLNSARFEQPFPDFLLKFSDIKGELVANRRFSPNEYLGGEMAGASVMPSGSPIHISLEIVDPGSDAVNYTASIPVR